MSSISDLLFPARFPPYRAPVTAAFLFPAALLIDYHKLSAKVIEMTPDQRLSIVLVLLTNGVLVFCLLNCEYLIVKATSSLTLSVAGIFKELVRIKWRDT